MIKLLKLIKLLSLSKYIKVTIQLVAYLYLFKNTTAQNLLQNGSFEIATNNDCYGAFDHHLSPNPHILDYWYNFNSPDYFSSACPGWYNVPNGYFGNSYAKHGNAYAGMYVYNKNSENKEYIYQQFNPPLQAGSIFCISFYVCRADRMPFSVKNIGAYFSNSLPTMINSYYISAIPQVSNQTIFLSDTTTWMKIEGCFTAQGGEQYITIGNFNTNSNTDTLRIQSTNPLTGAGTDIAYYYIDDVYLYDALTTGINETTNGNSMSIYPNPASSVISIKLADGNISTEKYSIKIADVVGKEILTEKYKEEIDISHLEKGIYFVSLYHNDHLVKTKKVVKE